MYWIKDTVLLILVPGRDKLIWSFQLDSSKYPQYYLLREGQSIEKHFCRPGIDKENT